MTKNAPFSWGNKEKFISLSLFYFLRSMKTIITLLLMLFAIPSVAQNTKCFKGELMALNSPYVIYCTHSDSEEKEKNVHFWNSKTNQTDSLFSIEAKFLENALYYCDKNTIKKRHLSKDNNKDSILLKTEYNIENFYIADKNIIIAEVDSSSEKVNIMYYVDGKCSFRQSVPCHSEEMEWQISTIYSFDDYFLISVQYDLYIFDKKEKTLTNFIKDCPDFSMDETGNIYYTQNSEDFLSKTLYVSNIKEPTRKREIAKISGSIKMYSYTINNKNKTYALTDDKLYELKNQSLQPISNMSLSDDKGCKVIINPKEENFILNY